MTRYAKVVDGTVVGVYEDPSAQNIASLGLVEITNWGTRPPRPDATSRLVIVNGALAWQDLRTLADAKADRIAEIKDEALTRVQALYSNVDSFGALELVLAMWSQGLAAGAKNPQGDWATLLQIALAARNAVQAVRAATTKAAVAAVVVNWP